MPRSIPRLARAACAAALAAALVLALPAHAAQKKVSPRPARTPAPAVAPPPAEAAPAVQPGPPADATALRASPGGSSIGVGIGYWSGSKVGKGAALTVDYGLVRTPPSWQRLELEWRLAIMFARATEKNSLSQLVAAFPPTYLATGYEKTSAYVIEIAPTARVRLALGPTFALFVDAGVGIAQTMDTYERDEMYVGRTVKKENVTGLVVRGGAGLSWDASPGIRVMLIPLMGSLEVGPKYSAFEPTLAVAFRL